MAAGIASYSAQTWAVVAHRGAACPFKARSSATLAVSSQALVAAGDAELRQPPVQGIAGGIREPFHAQLRHPLLM